MVKVCSAHVLPQLAEHVVSNSCVRAEHNPEMDMSPMSVGVEAPPTPCSVHGFLEFSKS